MRLDFFRSKPGSIWTRNNVIHATEAIAAVGVGSIVGGNKGSTKALAGVVIVGIAWESLNALAIPRGHHQHFDYKGLLSFAVPAVIAWGLNRITRKR